LNGRKLRGNKGAAVEKKKNRKLKDEKNGENFIFLT
jgi:hypothetical protein